MIAFSAPFPPISWWTLALKDKKITLDHSEHYQKMSYRNRYYLATPQGKQLLSIPLLNGRNQRVPMAEVRIDNRIPWQTQHWRTLISLYNRSPFFQYFEHELLPLFQQEFDLLADFNLSGIRLLNQLLKLNLEISITESYKEDYPEETDIRQSLKPNATEDDEALNINSYYQVFADRSGFLPNCSILDLLFCEALQAPLILLPK